MLANCKILHSYEIKSVNLILLLLSAVDKNKSPLTTENFTFMRRPIGVDHGEEVRHASQSRGRGSSIFSSSAPQAKVGLVKQKEVKRTYKTPDMYLVHDDNDRQYDKPEVVIERDSDDFVSHIIASEVEGSKDGETSPAKPKICKLEKVGPGGIQTVQPSNEKVILSPEKKKSLKPTARKSTSQKTFRK